MPSQLTLRLKRRFFPDHTHPYRIFEREVRDRITPGSTVLDAGCGRTAERLARLAGESVHGIGLDLIPLKPGSTGLHLIQANLANMGLRSAIVDLVYSVSVMEHVQDPESVYGEVARVLKPGGRFLFLTPNLWDYGSLVAMMVPNRFHPWIVRRVEGRAEEDTFPTVYRSNTPSAIARLASGAGFTVQSCRYLGQNPSYLSFSAPLFLAGTLYQLLIQRLRFTQCLQGWLMAELRKA